MTQQLQLDFSNLGYRSHIIERARLVAWTITEGRDTKRVRRRVQASHQKLILIAINSFGLNCYASVATLAERASITERDAERAIKALKEQMLLAVEKESEKGYWPRNVYCLDFQALQSEIKAQTTRRELAQPPFQPVQPSAQPSAHPSAQPSAQPSAHMGGQRTNNSRTKETPPPRLNSPSRINHDAIPTDQWHGVEESLVELGVGKAAEATRSARQRGCSPEHCRELIAYYRQRLATPEHGWQAPAYVLLRRFLSASPRVAVTDGWFGASPRSTVSSQREASLQRTREMLDRIHGPKSERAKPTMAEQFEMMMSERR
jgi:hypothetical protein